MITIKELLGELVFPEVPEPVGKQGCLPGFSTPPDVVPLQRLWSGSAKTILQAAGGKLVMPKMPIPGVGYFAYCEDTEGNLFGVMQADANAK